MKRQVKECMTCYHHRDGICQLFDFECVNDKTKTSYATPEKWQERQDEYMERKLKIRERR